ncbi:hypothetical protein HZH68_005394 [Vespula germanica]|uniref:Uncharacterized protein n=1 Tax=Vespula germanica TaxID=30212 RepID=A0A834NEI3_VESGE|nr:hypothetical protein HZH68_005394 [Vespula germanica]
MKIILTLGKSGSQRPCEPSEGEVVPVATSESSIQPPSSWLLSLQRLLSLYHVVTVVEPQMTLQVTTLVRNDLIKLIAVHYLTKSRIMAGALTRQLVRATKLRGRLQPSGVNSDTNNSKSEDSHGTRNSKGGKETPHRLLRTCMYVFAQPVKANVRINVRIKRKVSQLGMPKDAGAKNQTHKVNVLRGSTSARVL